MLILNFAAFLNNMPREFSKIAQRAILQPNSQKHLIQRLNKYD